MDQEEVVILAGRGLLYGLGGGCYMDREEVVIWARRGLLYAGKPTCRKAAPSKIPVEKFCSDIVNLFLNLWIQKWSKW